MEPVSTAAAIIAGAKTAKELLDTFKSVCASVKGAAEGGKDLADAGQLIGSIFTAEDRVNELHQQATKKGDKQEIMQLVTTRAYIREEKRKLRTVLAWSCPTGMYQDWVALEKASKDAEHNAKVNKRIASRKKEPLEGFTVKQMITGFTIAMAVVAIICVAAVVFGWV